MDAVVEDEFVFFMGGHQQQRHPQVKVRRLLTDRIVQQTAVEFDPAGVCVHGYFLPLGLMVDGTWYRSVERQ